MNNLNDPRDLGQTPPSELTRGGPGASPQPAGIAVTDLSASDLLRKYPNGYVVSLSGVIYEVVQPASSLHAIATAHPFPPPGGGYFVTKPTTDRVRK